MMVTGAPLPQAPSPEGKSGMCLPSPQKLPLPDPSPAPPSPHSSPISVLPSVDPSPTLRPLSPPFQRQRCPIHPLPPQFSTAVGSPFLSSPHAEGNDHIKSPPSLPLIRPNLTPAPILLPLTQCGEEKKGAETPTAPFDGDWARAGHVASTDGATAGRGASPCFARDGRTGRGSGAFTLSFSSLAFYF